ncbi:MAG: hypothetical protein Q4B54_03100 [Coriobacteriales bacterium]|nr:hypothetical protein [Coriobacteriales bacterium]
MARENKDTEQATGVAAWNKDMGARRNGPSAANHHAKVNADRKRRVGILVALVVLLVACVVCFWPLNEQVKRGLWLRGGAEYTMSVSKADGSSPSADELNSSAQTISKRLTDSGISESRVAVQGDKLVITLPWYVDGDTYITALASSGLVEFVRMDEIGDADALAKISAGTTNVEMKSGTYTPFMDGSSIKSASVTEVSSGQYAITFTFNDAGAETFANVTRELAKTSGRIAIVISGRVVTAPGVSEEIAGGQVSVTGSFTKEEAQAIEAIAQSNSLPVSLKLESKTGVGPLVSSTGLMAIVGAIVAAFVIVSVLAFMRYRKLFVLVAGSMLVYGITLLGIMALASRLNMYVLTLPGLGAAVAAGMVTIFASWMTTSKFYGRISTGRSIKGAALDAPSEGMLALRLPTIIAGVVAAVLVFLPMPAARELGTTLLFGIICGLIALIWYGITMLRLLAAGSIQDDPAAWGAKVSAETSGEAHTTKRED